MNDKYRRTKSLATGYIAVFLKTLSIIVKEAEITKTRERNNSEKGNSY